MQAAASEIIDLTGLTASFLLGEVSTDRGFKRPDRAAEVGARLRLDGKPPLPVSARKQFAKRQTRGPLEHGRVMGLAHAARSINDAIGRKIGDDLNTLEAGLFDELARCRRR